MTPGIMQSDHMAIRSLIDEKLHDPSPLVREAGELARIEFDGMLAKADSTTVVVDKAPLAEAVQKWGSFQIDMAIEECAEFIVAAEHFKRSRDNNVAEEIADALIMLTQMALMFDTQTVQEIVNKKIDRLKYRLSIGDMEGKQ